MGYGIHLGAGLITGLTKLIASTKTEYERPTVDHRAFPDMNGLLTHSHSDLGVTVTSEN